METKFNLNDEVYYADLGNIKIHKANIVAMQIAVNPQNREESMTVYQLDVGVGLSGEDIFSSFEEAKTAMIELLGKFKDLKEPKDDSK